MTAEPLTPEQVEQWRSNPANDLLGPLFATLDAARERIAELETRSVTYWNCPECRRERDEARAECERWTEQARQFCQNAGYWRAKAERAEPVVEAAMVKNLRGANRALDAAVDAYRAQEGR